LKAILPYIVLVGLLFLSATMILQAQEHSKVLRDFEVWTELSFETKLSKKVGVELNQAVRLNDNAQSVKNVFTQIGIDYKINKRWKFGGDYRWIPESDEESENRFDVWLRYNKKILDRLEFSYRFKAETQTSNFSNFSNRFRNRIGLEYNIRKWKWDPSFQIEFFYVYRYDFNNFSRIRYVLETERELIDNLDLSLGILYQRNYHKTPLTSSTAALVGLSYKF